MQPEWNVQAGQYIRRRRELLNLTQLDVANRLSQQGVDLSVASYARIENGDSKAAWAEPAFVRALAQILQVSTKELLSVTGHIVGRNTDLGAERFVELLLTLPEEKWPFVEQMLRLLISEQEDTKSGSH